MNEIEYADVFSELRMCGFTEEEITELKAMKHSVSYLRSYLNIARDIEHMKNEDFEHILGVEHFD